MLIPFSKYSGCGNDFILIDNRKSFFPIHDGRMIAHLCQRKEGIGADGLILLENSKNADFLMRFFNSDGSEGEMCGNGIRCFHDFICQLRSESTEWTIEICGRTLTTKSIGKDVQVQMLPPEEIHWGMKIRGMTLHFLNTGVPHVVQFVDDLEKIDIHELGPFLRNHEKFFPKGANVNFAQVQGTKIRMRTYEKGVEAETLSCGTGATAVALSAAKTFSCKSPIQVQQRSGEILTIEFSKNGDKFTDILMQGPAKCIFKGKIEVVIAT